MRIGGGFAVASSIVVLSLGGCAPLVGGGMQKVSVETVGPKGAVMAANCELMNSKGSSFVPATPNAAMVYRDHGALSVVCNKNGLSEARVTVQPSMNGLGYSYPSHITVRMAKEGGMASG